MIARRVFMLRSALALLAATGIASAQTSRGRVANPPARPATSRLPFVINVADYGARAEAGFDNTQAFQKAADDLAKLAARATPAGSGFRTKVTMFIPAALDSYRVSRPVWIDSPFIEVRGEGQGSRVAMFPQHNYPIFIFGLRRDAVTRIDGKTVEMRADDERYRPDLFGKLDRAAVPARGRRLGFRTFGEAFLQSQASPLADGPRSSRRDWTTDHWTETDQLTLDFCVEGPKGGKIPASAQLFGMGVISADRAYPYIVWTPEPNTYRVTFRTQEKPFGPSTARTFWFSSGDATGPQRITAQIDLKAAKVGGFVNGRRAAVTEFLGPDWKPGLKFLENDYFPFLAADPGGDRPQLGASSGIDITYLGLSVARGLRYAEVKPGEPQRRADEGRIDDLYRYFDAEDPNVVGFFPWTDDPKTSGRVLTIQGGAAANKHRAAAFLLHSQQCREGGIVDNAIRDLHLVGGHLYGQNVAVAQVLDLKISGIRSTDAYHAIGSLNNGANYTVRMQDCVLEGTDSGYYALDQGLWARDVSFGTAGRATMRFTGCVVNMENVFVGFATAWNQSTIKIHAGDYGGNYAFSNILVDYEGDVYKHTPIYCERHPFAAGTSLRLKDILLGTVGKVPLITLREASPNYPNAYVSVDNLVASDKEIEAVIDVDGPGWRGEIKGLSVGKGERVRRSGSKTASKITVQE